MGVIALRELTIKYVNEDWLSEAINDRSRMTKLGTISQAMTGLLQCTRVCGLTQLLLCCVTTTTPLLCVSVIYVEIRYSHAPFVASGVLNSA